MERFSVVWGVSAAGVIMICEEDDTIFLQKRSDLVHGGKGKWSYPSGGMPDTDGKIDFINPRLIEIEKVPIEIKLYEDLVKQEWEEETNMPFIGKIIKHTITFSSYNFNFHLFIAICTLEEKETMLLNRHSGAKSIGHWEVAEDGWFMKEEMLNMDLWDVAWDKAMPLIFS